MSQIIQTQKGKKKSSFIEFLKKECVLVIAVTLAILSSFISIPKLSYIDFKVLILLFNLMDIDSCIFLVVVHLKLCRIWK